MSEDERSVDYDETCGGCVAGVDPFHTHGSRPASSASCTPTHEFVTDDRPKVDPPPDVPLQPCTTVEDPDLFFPAGRDPLFAEPAIALCRRCTMTRECLSYALTHEVSGVWGATTERQRLALRERHHIVAEPMSFDAYFKESA